MKIAITGATGQLGQLTIAALRQKIAATDIIALSRDPKKAQQLTNQGIEVRYFDYNQPNSLQPALEGVDRLLLISGSEIGQRVAQHQAVIQAAVNASVKFIAYTSLLHADHNPLSLAAEHKATEALIKDSGLHYALLRNNWYVENYLANIAYTVSEGKLYGAAQDGKISAASRQDYALAAAHVLLNIPADNTTYELAGSQSFTLAELANTIGAVYNTPVEYINLTAEDYTQALVGAGLPQGLVDVIVDADVQTVKGALYSESTDLATLIGRPTTTIKELLEQQKTA